MASRILEGLATSQSIDLVGDSIKATGVTITEGTPILGGHNAESPIGKVIAVKTVPNVGVIIRASIIPAGQSQLADNWWAALRHGASVGLSVGFRSNDGGKPNKAGGNDYATAAVHEISMVPIPCNSECVCRIIEDDLPSATPAKALAKPAKDDAKAAKVAAMQAETKESVAKAMGFKSHADRKAKLAALGIALD